MRRGLMNGRDGGTLVELLVVLVVMAVIVSVSAFAVGAPAAAGAGGDVARLAETRARAIRSGAPISAARDSGAAPVLFLPDGQAVGAGVDRLTGEPSDARVR
jgi:Tfp pilus assembly protein FimT